MIADLQMCSRTCGLDDARPFVAEHHRELDRLAGLGNVQVAATDTTCVDSNSHFTAFGFAEIGFDDLEPSTRAFENGGSYLHRPASRRAGNSSPVNTNV
jgi:hypothetical protein